MKGIALVTGAADRIGAAIATQLASTDYAVVVHYRNSSEKAERLVDQIKTHGGTAAALGADLGVRTQREDLISRAASLFGPLTVLINNASIFEPDSPGTLDYALWDQHMAIHAEAPVFLTRDFAAQLAAGEKGNVINIIDERVLNLSPDYFSYTLSKSLLWTATRTLAQSLAPHIRVNAIGPGPTLQNIHQNEGQFAASRHRLPLGEGPTCEDIARGVAMLLAMPSMTGQMLALDGGEHLEWPEHNGPTPRKP